jgi:hypothetical protein
MQRGAFSLALMAALAVGAGACKSKKKSAPSPSVGSGSQGTAAGPTSHVPPKPPKPPPPTAPDPGYEERRRLLLQRGNPEMMKAAPVAQTTAPDVKPEQLIKSLGKDLLQVGTNIKVDLAKGRAEIPAKVAATTQPLEYVAVGPNGKAYESLLIVDVTAIELRLALSLMGYDGTMPQKPEGKVAPATPEDTVFLSAIVGGKERPVSAYMIDKKTKKPPKDIPWQVIGFQAEDRDQSLLTRDFFTLVARDYFAPVRYSIDPGNSYAGPDEGYVGNPKALPADATVTLVIKRNPAKPAMPAMPDMTNPTQPFPITPTPGP